MTDLLITLREATEPSRELDARIHAWVNGWKFNGWNPSGKGVFNLRRSYKDFHSREVPHYTSNLQDALELVPEGWLCSITQDDSRLWWAELRHGYQTSFTEVVLSARRPNPALALATSAVEARMKLGAAA